MDSNKIIDTKRLLASLTPETLNRLADLIVSKLRTRRSDSLLSKQVVTGSNPVSRSKNSLSFPVYLLSFPCRICNGHRMVTIIY